MRKYFLIILSMFLVTTSFVLVDRTLLNTTYYVSNTGSDSNDGLSPGTAWQTIDKVNSSMSLFGAGDDILFNKGDIFTGTLRITKSGTLLGGDITIGFYGTGDMPVFSAFEDVTSWTSIGSNKWTATPSAKADVNMVVYDNSVAQIAQFPNGNNWIPSTANGTVVTKGGINTVTVGTTPVAVAGDEIIIKKKDWSHDRDTITSIAGNVISYRQPYSGNIYPGIVGYGIKYQGNPSFLDIPGEWSFRSGTLTMYSTDNPSLHDVRISVSDTGIYLGSNGHITVEGIAFEGHNDYGVLSFHGSGGTGNVTVQDCEFYYMGRSAVTLWQCPTATIQRSYAQDCLGNAFFIRNDGSGGLDHSYLLENSSLRTCQMPGQEIPGDAAGRAGMTANGKNDVVIYKCIAVSSGYAGIEWEAVTGLRLTKCIVDTFCNRRQDGGGIYSFSALTQNGYNGRTYPTWSDNLIQDNIVLNGIGSNAGTTTTLKARGIYCDEGTNGVLIYNNTTAFIASFGLYGNSNKNITFRSNMVYLTAGVTHQRFKDAPNDTLVRYVSNYIFPYSFGWFDMAADSAYPRTYSTTMETAGLQSIQASVFFDSTKYFLPATTTTPFIVYARKYTTSTGSAYKYRNWAYWTGTIGFDANSVATFSATDELRFEVNKTDAEVEVSLGGNYLDMDGNTGSVATIRPYGSWLGKFVSPTPPTTNSERFLSPWILHE